VRCFRNCLEHAPPTVYAPPESRVLLPGHVLLALTLARRPHAEAAARCGSAGAYPRSSPGPIVTRRVLQVVLGTCRTQRSCAKADRVAQNRWSCRRLYTGARSGSYGHWPSWRAGLSKLTRPGHSPQRLAPPCLPATPSACRSSRPPNRWPKRQTAIQRPNAGRARPGAAPTDRRIPTAP
jgi:hypothetical protein